MAVCAGPVPDPTKICADGSLPTLIDFFDCVVRDVLFSGGGSFFVGACQARSLCRCRASALASSFSLFPRRESIFFDSYFFL